jgi:hypothetical protein
MDAEEINHESYLKTEVWCTIHSGGQKFFGRMCEELYNTPHDGLLVGSLSAAQALQDFLLGKRNFDFSPIFTYVMEEVPLDERGKPLSPAEMEQLKRSRLPPPALGRQPMFLPYDFTTGPLLVVVDSLQIGNLCSETDQVTYERMIWRALRQHKLTKANSAGLVTAKSMDEIKRPPPGIHR